MKKFSFISLLILAFFVYTSAKAQSPYDSIAFHLYTDSLKVGVANYISIDGRRRTDARWFPLMESELKVTTSAGVLDGMNLYLDSSFKADSVVINARLLQDSKQAIRTIIFMKKDLRVPVLKTEEEIMRELQQAAPVRKPKKNNRA